MLTRKILVGLCLGLVFCSLPGTSEAYDRAKASAYVQQWVNTVFGRTDFGNPAYHASAVDHVHNKRPANLHPATDPSDNHDYTWYYALGVTLFGRTFHYHRSNNDGDGTQPESNGEDCTNFVSQALIAGGIQFPPATAGDVRRGRDGTIKVVKALDLELRGISTVRTANTPADLAGAQLDVGDVIEFGGRHMTMVVNTSPLQVAYHSYDNNPVFPADIMSQKEMRPAIAFHINSDTLPQMPSDQVPPAIGLTDARGNSIPDLGSVALATLSGTAMDSDTGIQSFVLTSGGPIIESIGDVLSGTANEVFRDDTPHAPGQIAQYTFPALSNGVYFAEAFDGAGNYSVTSFIVANSPPLVTIRDSKFQSEVDYLVKDFSGVETSVLSTIMPSFANVSAGLDVLVNSSAGLDSVTLVGKTTGQKYGGLVGGATSYFVRASNPIPRDTYVMTAKDVNGNSTVVPVAVETMSASISGTQITSFPSFCNPGFTTTLNVAASAGLDHATVQGYILPPSGAPVPLAANNIPLSGQTASSPLTIAPAPSGYITGMYHVSIFDADGNSSAFDFSPLFPAPPQPGGLPGMAPPPCTAVGSNATGPLIRTELDDQPAGSVIDTPLGLGASVHNLAVTGSVFLDLYVQNAPQYNAGYQSASNGLMYSLLVAPAQGNSVTGGSIAGDFTLNLPLSPGIDPLLFPQTAFSVVDDALRIGPAQPVTVNGSLAAVKLTASSGNGNGIYNTILETPAFNNTVFLNSNGALFAYNGALNSGVTMSPADPTQQPLAGLLAQASAAGLTLNGPVFLLGPEGTTFGVPAYISLPSTVRGGAIYELSPGLSPQLQANQSSGYQSNLVSAQVTNIASYFAVFTGSLTVAPSDILPPRTTLNIGAPMFSSGTIYVSAVTPFSLAAVDDKKTVGDGAGTVKQTFIAVDTTTFAIYAGSFSLNGEGVRTLRYYSVDLAGNAEAVKTSTVALDATPPVTTLASSGPSVAVSGTLTISSTTALSLAAVDPLSGGIASGVAFTRYRLAQGAAVSTSTFQNFAAPFSLAEGVWRVDFQSQDNVANLEALKSSSVFVDATPPVSELVIGTPQFSLSSSTILVSALTPLTISAVDPVANGVASGLQATFLRVSDPAPSTAPFSLYGGTFTLSAPDAAKLIQFYSRDNVQNTEAVESASLLLDSTPPEVALMSPGTCPGGICRVLKGKFPVIGTARDLHFASYVLDAAPGQNATTGYALISSGTAPVSSSALGAWDASAFAGWQTLRLTATDLVTNTAAVTVNVYIGDPGEIMALGDHDVFDMPQGVAADAAGNVYVADTNADRIAVFSATGTFIAAFGRRDGDDGARGAGMRLSKPRGVAVDGAGNVFIADTNDNRLLKLSTTGQLLLAVGRREKRDKDDAHERAEFAPGKGLGEFDKPSGVALDASGNIFVADTNNGRVQKLRPDGTPLLAFALPPLPARPNGDKDRDGDDRPTMGRPIGIALDAVGNVYVADPAGGRALVFGATGQLLTTLPITGTTKDGKTLPGRPTGIAVSTDGYCLLVSDQRFDRVLKFDSLGDQTLAFGAPGKRGDDKPGTGIFLRRPAGLALAPDATLLVADRNDDRVLRVGLPTGAPTLVVPPPRPDRDDDARDVVERDGGGTVARRDGAGVSIPPNALPDDLKITVSTMSLASAVQSAAMDIVAGGKGLKPAYAPVEYGPEGTKFSAPVQLVVPYNPQLIASQGLSEDSLKVHYWNKQRGDWEALESVVDKNAHTVSAKTPHFSLYQVLGSTGAGYGVLAADATYGLKAAYAFPNPVRTGALTIRIQPGLADSVSVRVYDVAGRKVHESSDFVLSTLDDGNGLGAQYTYDHAWDISGVGSGVYTYVITAKKAGQADIHKTGRAGVVK